MKVNIIEKKYSATEKMKEKMATKLSKFDKIFGVSTEAQLMLSKEKDREICEITIYFRDTIFRVEETSKDMYESFDECIENLKKQIRKYKTKLEKKFKKSDYKDDGWSFEKEVYEETDDREFNIIKSKKISIKPMFTEEAILQMNLLGHEFFVYRNAETEEIDIVYKRKNGDYGLIETR